MLEPDDNQDLELVEVFNRNIFSTPNHLNSIISIKPLDKEQYPGLHLFTLDIFCFIDNNTVNKKQVILLDTIEKRLLYYFHPFECNFDTNFFYKFPEKLIIRNTQNYMNILSKYYIYNQNYIYSLEIEKMIFIEKEDYELCHRF